MAPDPQLRRLEIHAARTYLCQHHHRLHVARCASEPPTADATTARTARRPSSEFTHCQGFHAEGKLVFARPADAARRGLATARCPDLRIAVAEFPRHRRAHPKGGGRVNANGKVLICVEGRIRAWQIPTPGDFIVALAFLPNVHAAFCSTWTELPRLCSATPTRVKQGGSECSRGTTHSERYLGMGPRNLCSKFASKTLPTWKTEASLPVSLNLLGATGTLFQGRSPSPVNSMSKRIPRIIQIVWKRFKDISRRG